MEFVTGHLGVLLPPCAGSMKVVSNEVEAQHPIQLTEGTFDSEIRRVPSSFGVIVEFYAHWYALEALGCSLFAFAFLCTQGFTMLNRCPTCQAFQPAYEEVAAYFHAEPKVQPEIWVARVDCAKEVCTSATADMMSAHCSCC